MRNLENLFRTLSELIYLTLNAHLFNWIFYLLDINHAFISKRMEQIVSLDGLLTSLLVSENQVNPFVKVFRNILRLKSSSVDLEIGVSTSFGPQWHLNIINFLFILSDA